MTHIVRMAQLPTLIEQFPPPPLDEVIARIASFNTDDRLARRETIHRLVETHAVLAYRWGGGWRFRRARRITGQQPPADVGGLIWREGLPVPIGRANAAGFQVLYLADRCDTALSEVRARDDQVIVTEFQIRPGKSILVAPIGELSQIHRTGRGILTSKAAKEITGMLNACDLDGGRSMLIVDAFLLDCLSNRDDDYERSSAVAMAVFDKLPAVAAVAFPSRRQPGAVNFAVRADTLWDSWGITGVQEARATHLAMGYYRLRQASHVSGITNAGALVWSEDLPEDVESVMLLDPPWHPPPADGQA